MNKKIVSIACLSIFAIVVISILGVIVSTFGITAITSTIMKSNPVYQQGMNQIKNDPSVQEIFGTPVKDGFFVGGEVGSNAFGSGHANFTVAIRGPKANGSARIRGMKGEDEDWRLEAITIRVNGEEALIYDKDDHTFHPWE